MDGGIKGTSSRATNKLSDRAVRSFIRSAKPGQRVSDGGGMYLAITPARTPVWRVKYRLGGKEQLYSIGPFSEVSLEAARKQRAWLKEQLREGRDPVQTRAVNRAAAVVASDATFGAVTADWLEKRKKGWSAIHYKKSKRALERDVLPFLGPLPVGEIEPKMVAGVIEAIDKRGARETAARVLQHVTAIIRLAQARGLRKDNPATPVHEVLTKPKAVVHRPARTDWKSLGEILRGAEAANLSRAVRLAHRLCAFSVQRVSNVVQAEWSEFDLEASPALWTIPRGKMKVQGRVFAHKVFLGQSIVAELRAWRSVSSGKRFVFPSPAGGKRGRPYISREALEKAYRETLRLRDQHTPHGWRSSFSTLARDHGHEREVVELAQDRIHDNEVARAYDRGERLAKRISLMKWWDAGLTRAEGGADILPLKPSRQSKAA